MRGISEDAVHLHFSDVEVRLTWSSVHGARAAGDYLARTGHPAAKASAAGSGIHVCLRSGPSFVLPDDASEVAHYEAEGIRVWKTAAHTWCGSDPGHIRVRITPEASSAEVALGTAAAETPGARYTVYTSLQFAVLTLLRYHGLFPLHAAGLVHPSGAGVLLVGPSDAGKSTLAYSLVSAGWRYLSDDTVLLSKEGDRVEASGYQRRFGLDPDAPDLFGELEGASRRDFSATEGKLSIDVDALHPGAGAVRCAPSAVILPRITGRPTTVLQAATEMEAFQALLSQSALVRTAPELTQRCFDTLTALCRQAPATTLLAGHDIKGNPARADATVKGVLEPLP